MRISSKFLAIGVTTFLFGMLILLLSSPNFIKLEGIPFAVTIDLLLVVPLVYFLLIRKTTIPKTTVVPVMILGLVIGSLFMPAEKQTYLSYFKTWILPLVELSVVSFVIFKVRSSIKKFKSLKIDSPDFFTTLKQTCYEILPKKLVLPFATEIAVFYYGFVNWKTRKPLENEFTNHKNSTAISVFVGLLLAISVETFAFHALLNRWSSLAAWIFTCASIYTAIQIFGFVRSLSKRPISITKNGLMLKYGIMNEVKIPFSDIDKVELGSQQLEKKNLEISLSILGELEAHNVVVSLKNENELTGLYGLKKKFIKIGFHIDEPKVFIEQMDSKLEECGGLV